jgi:hypothetical protein
MRTRILKDSRRKRLENAEGAEYMAVCLPAFSIQTVHRDE